VIRRQIGREIFGRARKGTQFFQHWRARMSGDRSHSRNFCCSCGGSFSMADSISATVLTAKRCLNKISLANLIWQAHEPRFTVKKRCNILKINREISKI
jgi:hypothetical protein